MRAKTINRNPEWVDIVQFSDSGENLGRAHVQKVVKTDEEWLRQLGQEAFDITRRADTELAAAVAALISPSPVLTEAGRTG